jgi:GDP-mannose 6-dehydrogenase
MNNPIKHRVVIIGYGWVGQANALAAALLGHTVGYFDIAEPVLHFSKKYKDTYSQISALATPLAWDAPDTTYLVCVGDKVSEEGIQDLSLVNAALGTIKKAKGIVVLRSTVLPKSLTKLPFRYYFPEFLHEKYAVEECLKSPFFVLGSKGTPNNLPLILKKFRKEAQREFIGTPIEASNIKYLSNIWNALRIAFVNEYGDGMQLGSGLSVHRVHKLFSFFFQDAAYLKYGKEFDGHCLPKDVRAMRNYHDKTNAILAALYDSNIKHAKLMRGKNIKKWYAAW